MVSARRGRQGPLSSRRADRRRGDGREKDAERGAVAQLALDFDPALMLLDDAINRRQPQAGALADFLGGEERLERCGKCSGAMPVPVSADAQADKLAGAGVGLSAA